MIRPRSILPALLSLAIAAPTSAATLHVPSQFPTIQAGITAAVAGDTVEVACGTYYESNLVLPAGVVLRSATGLPDCVMINGELGNPENRGILTCSGDSSTAVQGLTLTLGYDEDNGGGLRLSGSPIIDHCAITSCSSLSFGGGVWCTPGSAPTFRDCEFLNNNGESVGAIALVGSQGTFERCDFIGNRARNGAAGAISGSGSFLDCYFGQNSAEFWAGAIEGGTITLINCVFDGNVAGDVSGTVEGGAVACGALTAIGCTFFANEVYPGPGYASEGSTIRAISGLIKNCIVVGNPCASTTELCGTVVHGGPGLIIECTNIWHPTENAWAGSIGSQLGQNGNVSVDPKFCADTGGDFRLSSISPCLDTPCGTMGAFGLGCFDAKPVIISIDDVGNDQGRQVRLTWYRAQDDFAGSPFDGYAIYRRQDLYAAAPEAIQTSGRGAFALPGWDYVTTVPNRWDDVYQVIVPTLCDSTITSGQCWSAFFVSAMTPTAFYDSPVDSGYSKDNLAPPTPTGFTVTYNTGSGNHLVWDAVAANDWAGFRIYRDDSPGFTPSPATLVHSTTQTTWDDPSFDGWDVHYRVTSFDLAGNESAPTEFTSVTDVRDNPRPLSLELGPNVPNPFNPSTTIPFTIPTAGRVTITIYDVTGARVRTLVNREYQPGHHSAVWDGRNDAGGAAGSGVYVTQLRHLGGTVTRKAVVLK